MESIIEYSEICDIVKGISDINLNNIKIYKQQREIVENNYSSSEDSDTNENDYIMISKDLDDYNDNSSNMDIEDEKKQLHFQDSYNEMDYILSINLMKMVIPFSEYLTSLINTFLLDKMMHLIDINCKVKDLNISSLIEFYHFSLDFIKKFYSFKQQLNDYEEETLSDKDDIIRKERLRKYAINLMNNSFKYKKLKNIFHFLHHMNNGIDFGKDSSTYKDLTPISKTFLIKIKQTTQQLIEKMEPYIDEPIEFKQMRIYKKLEFIVPFMNIIQFIFYILIKNPISF